MHWLPILRSDMRERVRNTKGNGVKMSRDMLDDYACGMRGAHPVVSEKQSIHAQHPKFSGLLCLA